MASRPNQHTAVMPPYEAEAVIFRALADAAAQSQPCPTADDLAALIPDGSVTRTVDIVRRLEQRGVIAVKRYQRGRQVLIVSTGDLTQPPASASIHWRLRPKTIPAPTVDSIRTRNPDIFRQIEAAASREQRLVADFLGDLVFMGLDSYQQDRELI